MNDSDGPGASGWPRVRTLALLAEEGGLDSLWVYDHFIFRIPGEPEDGIHEAWTLLTATAAVTAQGGAGHDRPGDGLPGAGAAGQDGRDARRGVERAPDPGPGHGLARARIRAPSATRSTTVPAASRRRWRSSCPLLRGERVTFHGRWHDVEDAVLIPPPPRPARVPGRMPILIAAKGERVLRLAARHADAWNAAWFGFPNERFGQRRADLLAACEAEGRDPATLEVTVGLTIDSEARRWRTARCPGRAPARRRHGDEGPGRVARPRRGSRPGGPAPG